MSVWYLPTLGVALEDRTNSARASKAKLQNDIDQYNKEIAILETEQKAKQKEADEVMRQKLALEEQRQQVSSYSFT